MKVVTSQDLKIKAATRARRRFMIISCKPSEIIERKLPIEKISALKLTSLLDLLSAACCILPPMDPLPPSSFISNPLFNPRALQASWFYNDIRLFHSPFFTQQSFTCFPTSIILSRENSIVVSYKMQLVHFPKFYFNLSSTCWHETVKCEITGHLKSKKGYVKPRIRFLKWGNGFFEIVKR